MICNDLGSRWRWTWLLFHLPSDPRLISHLLARRVSDWSSNMSLLLPVLWLKDALPPFLWLSALNVKLWRYHPSHRLLSKPCKLTVWCTDAMMTKYIDFTDWVFFFFLILSKYRFLAPRVETHLHIHLSVRVLYKCPYKQDVNMPICRRRWKHTHFSHTQYGPYNPRRREKRQLLELIYSLELFLNLNCALYVPSFNRTITSFNCSKGQHYFSEDFEVVVFATTPVDN